MWGVVGGWLAGNNITKQLKQKQMSHPTSLFSPFDCCLSVALKGRSGGGGGGGGGGCSKSKEQ